MRVLCIHPNSDYNIGDLMTLWGTKYLMRVAFDDVEFLQFDSRRAELEIETYVPEYNWGDVDAIVLAGSPWVSPHTDDIKLRMLRQAKVRWPYALRFALGIGSALRCSDVNAGRYCPGPNEDLGPSAECFGDFHVLFVRDAITRDILTERGVSCRLYYDTSIFSRQRLWPGKQARRGSVLIYMDPARDVSLWDQLPDYFWEAWVDYQFAWAKEHRADVLVISSGDKASADERMMGVRFVTDLEWMARRLAAAQSVLSPRVHQCVLAVIMGCRDVACMPVDSRYLTALNLGVSIVQPKVKIRDPDDPRVPGVKGEQVFPFAFEDDPLPFNLKLLTKGSYEAVIVKALREAI